MKSLTERLFGRSFGQQPEIRDGVRASALVLQSVAGLRPSLTNMDRRIVGSWNHWACGIPLLVEVPGREPYALSPVRWMSRERYPIAGTTLPVTIERDDPASLRIEWEQVPTIDEWIASGHPVFTDPDTVQARFDAGWKAHRAAVVEGGSRSVAQEVAAASAGELDGERLAELIAAEQAEHAAGVPKPVLHRAHIDGPSGRIIAAARMDDDGNAKKMYGEVLLSVAVPGAPRYGLRWTGSLPASKLRLEWWDVPLTVTPDDPTRVKIRWEDAAGIEVIAPLLGEWNERLEAQLGADATTDAERLNGLLAAIPDPERRAQAERGLAQGLARATLGPPAADPLDELARLGEAHREGRLSDEAFAAEKARLLEEI